jgi:hypothetical protein
MKKSEPKPPSCSLNTDPTIIPVDCRPICWALKPYLGVKSWGISIVSRTEEKLNITQCKKRSERARLDTQTSLLASRNQQMIGVGIQWGVDVWRPRSMGCGRGSGGILHEVSRVLLAFESSA